MNGLTRVSLSIALLLGVWPTARAQEGSASFPSLSAEAGHLYLLNRTSGEVIFYLETENTVRTEHRLRAGESAIFTGAEGDSWFNIFVYSNGTHVTYGLDAGTRHYFEWTSRGVLDVYKLPPQ